MRSIVALLTLRWGDSLSLHAKNNMKQLSPKVHGILDYATVVFLLCSPYLFDMQPNGRLFTFALGFVHLVLTLITDFPMGIFKIVPLRIHGIIELIVSVVLLIIANI